MARPRRCRPSSAAVSTTPTAARTSPGGRITPGCRIRPVRAIASVGTTEGERVLLAKPRGYCAGVDRAVQTVEHALEHYGAPVYVRKQIVHNLHVVRALEERGAVFVEE